jgi:hypothetical protein
MISFKTTNNLIFTINIKTKDLQAVKDMVKYKNGQPVDILEAAETGTLVAVYGDVSTFVDVCFMLCLDQVKSHFDLAAFDEENQWIYEQFPERKREPVMVKASRWFGSLINGETLIQMIEAFNEGVVNFTPNENRRKAMRLILEKEKEMDRLETEYRTKTVERMFQQASDNLGKQWESISKEQIETFLQEPDGQSE